MKTIVRFSLVVLAALVSLTTGCGPTGQPRSASGVNIASTEVQTGADGLTTEQRNIRDRLKEDNKSGSIKHLYIVSAYSGQVLLYSTVRGKVTSSGKRLTPINVSSGRENCWGVPVQIGKDQYYTGEVLQDDGTYGTSSEYIYWWDVSGAYHQHYPSGGQITHISDKPLRMKRNIIDLEITPAQ